MKIDLGKIFKSDKNKTLENLEVKFSIKLIILASLINIFLFPLHIFGLI